MPKPEDEGKVWVPCKCGIFCFISAENPSLFPSIFLRSAISAHRVKALNIQFVFCKEEALHKLKHIFCFGGCFRFFTEKEFLRYGTIMDIPHQRNTMTEIRNIGSLV